MFHRSEFFAQAGVERTVENMEPADKATMELQQETVGIAIRRIMGRMFNKCAVKGEFRDVNGAVGVLLVEFIGNAFRTGCCDGQRVTEDLYRELRSMSLGERVDDVMKWLGYTGGLGEFLDENSFAIERALKDANLLVPVTKTGNPIRRRTRRAARSAAGLA